MVVFIWIWSLPFPSPFLSFFDVLWNRKQSCNTQPQLSRSAPIPRHCFGSFLKKMMDRNYRWIPSVSWTKEWTFLRLIHIHIYVPLHQAVTKTPIRSIIFLTFRVINDKFCAQVWLSGHLWDTVLYFNGGILNPCWITRIPLKNATR